MKERWKEKLFWIKIVLGLLIVGGLFVAFIIFIGHPMERSRHAVKVQIKKNGEELDKIGKRMERVRLKLKKLVELEEKEANGK